MIALAAMPTIAYAQATVAPGATPAASAPQPGLYGPPAPVAPPSAAPAARTASSTPDQAAPAQHHRGHRRGGAYLGADGGITPH
ncbi:hypothetical protein FIM10_18525 [Sphingomonadales bacterium 56]|uniref:Uncharacterized protein n=2 Tax=Sphingobium TaxID=165695 RepID=A0A1L5BRM0_SPHIB|nr:MULTISPECIES: hypothetical protein [Sphingobium]APL95516.1 hypothetical protein SIDU_13900 [Sphingobium indicum B90A]MBY2930678.1 hypothetical protein [Sphingomonadales bacterium 56]